MRVGLSSVVQQIPPVCLLEEAARSLVEELVPQDCLDVSEPSVAGLSVQVHQTVDAVAGSDQGIVSEARLICNPTSHEVSLFPREEDLPASPWEEASGSGVVDTVKVPVMEVIPAKAICAPEKAPSLI